MNLANRQTRPATNGFHAEAEADPAMARVAKALSEAAGLLRGPHRALPLARKLAADKLKVTFERPHLYSYTTAKSSTHDALKLLARWILDAQRPDGGIAAYYSLLSGYSESYPEVTGYIVPTLYEVARSTGDHNAASAAERATHWLLSLQMPSGAFPAGVHCDRPQASVFNTGQILQGLVRAYLETDRTDLREAAIAAGNWLVDQQHTDGSWSGQATYQQASHTYYSMVSWALAQLSVTVDEERYGRAAEKNLDWVLRHITPSGWIDGINLRGHPNYLHFIAYAFQGSIECAVLRGRRDAVHKVANSAWVLLRKFESNKFLRGAYEPDFTGNHNFTCLTGDAQMSCVWLRLFQQTGDLHYLNAALKMNEMLKQQVPARGGRGIAGGVCGSYPVWGAYQPLRYISWGCKFLVDALLLEQKLTRQFEAAACAS